MDKLLERPDLDDDLENHALWVNMYFLTDGRIFKGQGISDKEDRLKCGQEYLDAIREDLENGWTYTDKEDFGKRIMIRKFSHFIPMPV